MRGVGGIADTGHGDLQEFAALKSAVRLYCRTFDRVFARARGAILFDQDGRRFIDFLSGAGVVNYGHNNPHIKRAVIEYLKRVRGPAVSRSAHHGEARLPAQLPPDLILTPRALDYRVQCCGPTGADAVEAALKLARMTTNRSTVVAFSNAYHGMTLGALAVTANPRKRAAAGIPLEHVLRLPFDGPAGPDGDAMAALRAALARRGAAKPGAIIVETVQAEGGINVASPAWLRGLSELAAAEAVPLIVDDIQVGCGRTGHFLVSNGPGSVLTSSVFRRRSAGSACRWPLS